jgi:hypothetical protein
MAKRFTFSTKDLLFVTTLIAVGLSWFISDRQRLKQIKEKVAIADKLCVERRKFMVDYFEKQLATARALLNDDDKRILQANTLLNAENLSLQVQVEALQKRVNK